MKKMVITFIMVLFLTGCGNDLMNTPTKRVETMLNNYVTLDEKVLNDLEDIMKEETVMTQDQKGRYKDVLKHQYKNLAYKIKDETIDGDIATVEVELEVYDYRKIIDEAEEYLNNNQQEFLGSDNNVDVSKFNDYKLDKLKNAKDKVTYTLDLTLKKVDDKWVLDDLTDTEISKIHGLYAY